MPSSSETALAKRTRMRSRGGPGKVAGGATKTRFPRGTVTCIYTTRHLPLSLLHRLRVIALLRQVTVEEAVNLALARGIKVLERQVLGRDK